MEITRHDEDEVYEASWAGDVEYLNRLIEKDPEIPRRISLQTGKIGTPLHVSALLGHVEFTKALCTNNPKLGERVDADGRTPLHLASAEGHKETIEPLCTPLHLASAEGHKETIEPLLSVYAEGHKKILLGLKKASLLWRCLSHKEE